MVPSPRASNSGRAPMGPRASRRAVWIASRAALLTVPSVMGFASACGSAQGVDGADAGASIEAGPVSLAPKATCPARAPEPEAPCVLPEGTTCDFGECGTRLARCTRGAWRYGENPAPVATCPAVPPEADASCPPCWPASAICTYGSTDCAAPDASLNTARASCAHGVWSIDFRACGDGGADVQPKEPEDAAASPDADVDDDAGRDAD